MKRKPAKKKPKQCISSKTKSTCQNSTTSEHFQKWPKNQGVVLALSLSNIHLSVHESDRYLRNRPLWAAVMSADNVCS